MSNVTTRLSSWKMAAVPLPCVQWTLSAGDGQRASVHRVFNAANQVDSRIGTLLQDVRMGACSGSG